MELFNPAVAVESLGPLLAGLLMTVELTIVVMALSLVFALFVALGGMSRFWPLRWVVKTYIEIIRGTPREKFAVVVMGRAHVQGFTRLLIERYGFKDA